MNAGARLEEILADNVSGATEIEGRLLEALRGLAGSDREDVLAALPEQLDERFPQMANVARVADDLRRLRSEPGPDRREEALLAWLGDRERDRRSHEERLSSVLSPMLPAGDLLVFTLSKSGTVGAVLEDLQRAGRRVTVLVAESRPGGEGARMARELDERGIRCRACDDFLLLSLVPREAAPRRPPGYTGSEVVLVGADAVHPDGLVNKVGTRALLETAQRAGIPAFVLASSTKLRQDRAPRVIGSLFETIPRRDVVVLTEKGPASG